MISIIIPTYNNLSYLKKCVESINKNSFYKNEILVHINQGNDGTIDYGHNSNSGSHDVYYLDQFSFIVNED